MAAVMIAECPTCRVSEFKVPQVTPDKGEPFLRLRCTRCEREYAADLKPKLQWVDEYPF